MVQQGISLDKLRKLQVPILGSQMQQHIAWLLDLAFDRRGSATRMLEQSSKLLFSNLGLPGGIAPEALTYQRTLRQVNESGRFDAQHFAPDAESVISSLKRQGHCITIAEVTVSVQRGSQPEYTDQGTPVVNSQHIHSGEVNIDGTNPLASRSKARVLIESGDVVINGTGVGTIGRAAAYVFPLPSVPDNHVTVLKLKKGSVDATYLAAFLNSRAGQVQVEKWLSGSSGQIELYPRDIQRLVMWIAPDEVQQTIRLKHELARQARKRASDLLQCARHAVDIAIKISEEAPPPSFKRNSEVEGGVMPAQVLAGGDEEAAGAGRRVADGVPRRGVPSAQP